MSPRPPITTWKSLCRLRWGRRRWANSLISAGNKNRPPLARGGLFLLPADMNSHSFEQVAADFGAMLDGHSSGMAVGVGTGSDKQVMLARVFAVGFNQFGGVVGMIDFDAVQGNRGAHF